MSGSLLLPHRYKRIGWWLLIPSLLAGSIILSAGYEPSWLNGKIFAVINTEVFNKSKWFSFISTNLAITFTGTLFIAGALMVGISKERVEDEFISKLRLSSLLWAVVVNYVVLLLAFILVYGTAFFTVMVYNMFTILIIFIARFNFILYKNSRIKDEKYN